MVAPLQIVCSDDVPHPLGPVLLFSLYGIGRVGNRSLGNRICEDALFFLSIVETECRLDVQVVYWVDVQEYVAERAPVGIAVVAVTLQASHRVLTVGIATHRTSKLSVGGVYWQRWVELQHVLQESAWSRHLAGAVQCEVLTYGNDVPVINLQELIVGVDTSRIALEVAALDDTLVLVVSQREE